jgi:octaprenyl-diphosphate synthase
MGPRGLKPRLDARLDAANLPRPLYEQASAVVSKLVGIHARWPLWPVPELPRRAALALGADDELAEGLAVASLLFYGASDLIDDAQDDELAQHPTWPGWDWRHAVNAGNLLLAALDAPAEARAAWAEAFARAGRRLARGQFRDFLATPEAPWGEAELVALLEDKAGASFGCLASLAPRWAGREDWEAWQAFGERLGMALQLASDIRPYLGFGEHKDLAVGKLTLPLLYARDVDPAIARLWAEGPLGHLGQEGLKARVAATGAVTYACMRVEVLKKEAHDRLATMAWPAAQELLAPLVDAVVLERMKT